MAAHSAPMKRLNQQCGARRASLRRPGPERQAWVEARECRKYDEGADGGGAIMTLTST